MIEGLRGTTDETRYGRVPLWLFETGASLQAVATYAWLHGQYGHYRQKIPSYAKLAKELGVSRGSVINYVKELAAVGAVGVCGRVDERGDRTTNEYVIAFNQPFPVGGQNADQGAEQAGDEQGDDADQGKHGDGGQDADQGGQPADQGGQHSDHGWSADWPAEEDVVEEDGTKKTTTNTPALPGMTDPAAAAAKPEPGSDADPEFTAWWAAYPKKVSKGQGRKAWRAARKKADFATLMVGLRRYLAEDPRAVAGYVKDPATWLNGECWLDEPDTIPRPQPRPAASNTDVWDQAAARWAAEDTEEVFR